MDNKATDAKQTVHQFLTFLLDGREYGLELFRIQEICGYAPITPIPNLPEHVRGVMNLRGTVANNTARNVDTGSNVIAGGSFSNASGLPTVIQNTGANVLIQNATIVNVRFGE